MEGMGRSKEEDEEREQRPEDGECTSRTGTCVGTYGATERKRKRDLFRTREKEEAQS